MANQIGMNRMHEPRLQGKSHDIPKRLVWEAWLKVKSKGGAAGPDGVTVTRFEADLRAGLYKLWNRMSSGSYFPGPVRMVEIPKPGGGTRVLGVPNVVDRIAQTVAVMVLEPLVEPVFCDDSYAYRAGRGPADAVAACRQRCFQRDWVLDLDIRAFFDSAPWELMEKAVAHHTDSAWVRLYVGRWLRAPMQHPDGRLVHREKGTAQGAVVSPLLANMLLHYGFDAWMAREHPTVWFERYSDDIVIHCVSEAAARRVRDAVADRLAGLGLELHPEKTRIVYCKDGRRRGTYHTVSFTFCGYTFRPRKAFDKRRRTAFTGFLPGVSTAKLTAMSRQAHAWRLIRRTTYTLDDLARDINPVVGGWLNYFTKFYPSLMIPLCKRIDRHLMRWARRKYKRLNSDKKAQAWLAGVRKRAPDLFAHWKLAYTT